MAQRRPEVVCPAGAFTEAGGERGVYCKIEQRFISFRQNPVTVVGRCSNFYSECSTWIAEKENDPAVAEAQGKPQMTTCGDCHGSGIDRRKEVTQTGLFVTMEYPCDLCRGTGKVAATPVS